ncbi:hypothetical protein C4M98_01070 [Mycoplasmopsis pullorum]|uniref:hypothetical protein n=1 Tax=Mycoplasmopsis pullorum TaxID=48003 RepID=UPI00111AD20B|nr:hypothetical protein [Mycoplasmopsis pullorum]TNK81581.1 hypothetical protein C4M94_03715 [Mycoplasmopsis pullorum]TNK82446.1 hypothetical protein C4M80_02970 [Mycoplasmopsis pullorum]TNK84073.1 hypothetical protein C4M81_03380 [Mycoplasmopsis pullorum]TNK84591.1 hypothetical protein C4M92_03200 [Mycoplasmopsis pullorum]TNK85937.1 hypothetical protein C4M85_01905 [Mycoplasmopsis pullorum]
MKFEKEHALNLLKQWQGTEKVLIIRDEILEKDQLFPEMTSLSYYTYANEYIYYVYEAIDKQEKREIDSEESFKEANDKINDIADDWSTDSESINYWKEINKKIEYLLDRKHLTNERIQELHLKELEEIANYHLINDYLIEFSKRFEAEFNKELELEQQNEISM